MENPLNKNETRLTQMFALMGGMFLVLGLGLGRCTAPTPQPVVMTEIEYVEVEKIVEVQVPVDTQRECIAQAVFAEFRGEPRAAAIAGGEVIRNRMADHRYPNTACEVINYKTVRDGKTTYHFSYQHRSDPNFYKTARVFAGMQVTAIEQKAKDRAYEIADIVMASNPSLPKTSLNYATTAVDNEWTRKLDVHSQIGATIFYVGY